MEQHTTSQHTTSHPLADQDLIPVKNVFAGRMQIKRKEIVRLLCIGKIRMTGTQGAEELEWVYNDNLTDSVIAMAGGSTPTRQVSHSERHSVHHHIEDANPGMPVLPLIGYDRTSYSYGTAAAAVTA